MIAAYWHQPLLQADIARWLGTSAIGTASSRIQRMEGRGFQVIYRIGSLKELQTWLDQDVPCILFLRTGELPYWNLDTPHAVVLAGLEAERAYLFDPAQETAPIPVAVGDLLLAWPILNTPTPYCLPRSELQPPRFLSVNSGKREIIMGQYTIWPRAPFVIPFDGDANPPPHDTGYTFRVA